jgi:hypothetical protein
MMRRHTDDGPGVSGIEGLDRHANLWSSAKNVACKVWLSIGDPTELHGIRQQRGDRQQVSY